MTRKKAVIDAIVATLHPVEDLEAALAPRGIRARELLAAHNIQVVDGFFSAAALAEALRVPVTTEASPSAARSERGVPDHATDEKEAPHRLLEAELLKVGIGLRDVQRRRGWHLTVSALQEERHIVTDEVAEEAKHDARLGPVVIGSDPVRARMYFVRRRHSGGAYFIASGYEATDGPLLHFFVLIEEQRVWVASSGVLAWLAGLGEDTEEHLDRVRVKPGEGPAGSMRIWFPRGSTSFDLEIQVRDAEGHTVVRLPRRT